MNNPTLIKCPACGSQVSNQAPSCPKCGQPISGRVYQPNIPPQPSQPQLPTMFQQYAEPAASAGVGKKLGIGCLVLFGFFVVLTIIGSLVSSNRGTLNQTIQSSPTPIASPQSSAPSQTKNTETKTDAAAALASFRKKLFSIPAGRQIVSKVELGAVPGVLNLYVTNAWFDGQTYARRQLTTQFVTLWQQELGTDNVIVHIYDMTGHEVAGSKFMGGVWVEDE